MIQDGGEEEEPIPKNIEEGAAQNHIIIENYNCFPVGQEDQTGIRHFDFWQNLNLMIPSYPLFSYNCSALENNVTLKSALCLTFSSILNCHIQ